MYLLCLFICPKLPAGNVYVNLMFQISSPERTSLDKLTLRFSSLNKIMAVVTLSVFFMFHMR